MKKITILFLLIFALFLFGCPNKKQLPKEADFINESTPKGAHLIDKYPASAEMKNAIDAAMTEVFADAAALGYTNKLVHSDYTVHLVEGCEPSPEGRVPSFKVRADNYDGTVYDQNPAPGIGEVFASELVATSGDQVFPEFYICNNLEFVGENARNGPEHIIYYFNDRQKFSDTATHYTGGHPIIPRRVPVPLSGRIIFHTEYGLGIEVKQKPPAE